MEDGGVGGSCLLRGQCNQLTGEIMRDVPYSLLQWSFSNFQILPSSGNQEFNHMNKLQNISQSITACGLITQIR